jgi:hypothetical protein
VDVPALTAASGASGGVDGKIESVQDGKALVRLSGGAQVQVSVDREIPQGTPVTVAAASDGTLQLTVRIPDAELAKLRDAIWKTLQSLVGDSLATELAVPLAKGDFAAAARSLPSAGNAGNPSGAARELATNSGEASATSGPIFLSDGSAPSPPRGDALLAVLSRVEQNVYAAEFAGQSQVLMGPSDVEPATRLLARAQPLPGGGAVWTPTPVSVAVDRGLPDRIQAGEDGARELLRWAGAADASPQEVADLGKALAEAARSLLDDAHPDLTETVASPVAPAPSASGFAPSPEDAEPIGLQTSASQAQVADATRTEENPAAAQVSNRRPEAPVSAAPAPTPNLPENVSPVGPNPSIVPSDPTQVPPPGGRTAKPSPAQIPSDVAVRVLAAWSLDLPATLAVQKAALGQTTQDLPEALASLEKLVQQNPGRHPALEAAMQNLRETGKLPAGTLSDGPRRSLEAAVLEALVQESSEGDAEPLRKAAQTLLSDRLPDRATGSESGQTYWASASGEWEKARIVVRDERERKGKGKGDVPSDFHSVDVAMDPTGLGRVEAHLELRGHVLTTRLQAVDPATTDLLRQRLPELAQAFSKLGLESGGLDVRRKAPAKTAAPRKRGAGGALDVRA